MSGATGFTINYGDSEDYMRGFNVGYDAADPTVSAPATPELNAPPDEPWRGSYIRGYTQGYQCRIEHEQDDDEREAIDGVNEAEEHD